MAFCAMSAKYIFDLQSEDRRRALPRKLIIGQRENEGLRHVVLKLLAFAMFYRDRLQVEGNIHNDNIPFEPDLVQLDYTLRPVLWIECGDCGVSKLHKLAVKVPEAEIWVMKGSPLEARNLVAAMAKEDLRRDRYQVIGFDTEMIQEMCGLVRPRNELLLVSVEFEPPQLQIDFNGLWFDAPFTHLRH
jgi:uncharacterized protein YaeQ